MFGIENLFNDSIRKIFETGLLDGCVCVFLSLFQTKKKVRGECLMVSGTERDGNRKSSVRRSVKQILDPFKKEWRKEVTKKKLVLGAGSYTRGLGFLISKFYLIRKFLIVQTSSNECLLSLTRSIIS